MNDMDIPALLLMLRCHLCNLMCAPFRLQLTLQEAGDFLQLWDVVGPVAAVLLQQGEDPVVFAAGMGWVQGLQLLEHGAPCCLFRLCVLHLGNGLATGTKITTVTAEADVGVLE